MALPKWPLVLLILTLGSQADEEGYDVLDAMQDVAFFFPGTSFVLDRAIQIWVSSNKVLRRTRKASTSESLDVVLAKLEKQSSDIRKIQESIQHEVMNLLPKEIDLDHKIHSVYENIGKVDFYFHRYVQYVDTSTKHRKDTIRRFREALLDPSAYGMQGHLSEIHRLLMDAESGVDIIKLLANPDQTNKLRCKREQSALHLISNFYNNVMVTEMKGILMTHYAYTLGKQNMERYTVEAEMKEYLTDAWQRISTFIPRVKSYMEVADSIVWKCDPPNHFPGETFFSIGTGDDGGHRSKKDRSFSLRDVTSDISKNYVVTGVKFVLENNMFYIQIQQGLLTQNANIVQKTVHWKPVEPFSYDAEGIKENTDYYHMKFGRMAINIETIELPYTSGIVTGVRFAKDKNSGYIYDGIQCLKLEIQMSTFNFDTGKLQEENVWFSNDASDSKRSQIKYNYSTIPFNHLNMPIPTEKGFVELNHLNYAGGVIPEGPYTLPFIDAQEISSTPATPLSGAGIGYRGAEGSSGFVTLTTKTFNYAPHLHTDTGDEIALQNFLTSYDQSLVDTSDLHLPGFEGILK